MSYLEVQESQEVETHPRRGGIELGGWGTWAWGLVGSVGGRIEQYCGVGRGLRTWVWVWVICGVVPGGTWEGEGGVKKKVLVVRAVMSARGEGRCEERKGF